MHIQTKNCSICLNICDRGNAAGKIKIKPKSVSIIVEKFVHSYCTQNYCIALKTYQHQ